jgi:hypothetical protein
LKGVLGRFELEGRGTGDCLTERINESGQKWGGLDHPRALGLREARTGCGKPSARLSGRSDVCS